MSLSIHSFLNMPEDDINASLPDSSSYFSMERFYFYWKATMNLLFPWETISMLFASRAPKTREKDNKLTQELSHLVKTHLPFRRPGWRFGEKRLAAAGACFSSDTKGCLYQRLHPSPRSRRGWLQPQVLASQYKSGLQKATCFLPSTSTERQ